MKYSGNIAKIRRENESSLRFLEKKSAESMSRKKPNGGDAKIFSLTIMLKTLSIITKYCM